VSVGIVLTGASAQRGASRPPSGNRNPDLPTESSWSARQPRRPGRRRL